MKVIAQSKTMGSTVTDTIYADFVRSVLNHSNLIYTSLVGQLLFKSKPKRFMFWPSNRFTDLTFCCCTSRFKLACLMLLLTKQVLLCALGPSYTTILFGFYFFHDPRLQGHVNRFILGLYFSIFCVLFHFEQHNRQWLQNGRPLQLLLQPLLNPAAFVPAAQLNTIQTMFARIQLAHRCLMWVFRLVTANLILYTLYWFYEQQLRHDYRWAFYMIPVVSLQYYTVMYVCWPNVVSTYVIFNVNEYVHMIALDCFARQLVARLCQIGRHAPAGLCRPHLVLGNPFFDFDKRVYLFRAIERTRQSPFLRRSTDQLHRQYDHIRRANHFYNRAVGYMQLLYVISFLFSFYYSLFSILPTSFRYMLFISLFSFTVFLLFPMYLINSCILDQVSHTFDLFKPILQNEHYDLFVLRSLFFILFFFFFCFFLLFLAFRNDRCNAFNDCITQYWLEPTRSFACRHACCRWQTKIERSLAFRCTI